MRCVNEKRERNGKSLCLLFLCCLLSLSAAEAQSTGKKITYQCENEKLPAALRQVERLSAYYKVQFAYEDVESYKVTVDLKEATIADAMSALLKGTGLWYETNGRFIQVFKAATASRKLRGTVMDEHSLPMIGATVMIKGTHIGAATDTDGIYEIDVKPGDVLVYSYIGMEQKEEIYDGRTSRLNIIMRESSQTQLDDVVVTGIFKKAKESYTGSVSTVTKEQLQMYRGQNLLQTLKNIDPSINMAVNNAAGSNPNTIPSISIRGNSSLPTSLQEYSEDANNDANTPLIIMDGFEITLTRLMDYNDDEIESINILKDASATAIYGSRGSNGVIVVTTKQPEPGRFRVSAEIGLDIEVPDLTSYDILNASDKLELERLAGLYNNEYSGQNGVSYINTYYERLRNVLSGVDTDWLSKPLHNGIGSRYNIRLEGGSEQFRWSATAQYKNIEGAMKGSNRRTFNGTITLMYKVKDFTFKNQTSYGMSRAVESKYGDFSDYVSQQPYNSPYDSDGNVVRYFDGFYSSSEKTQNPLYDATLNSVDKTGYETLTNNFAVEWNPFEGFTVRGQLGITSTGNTSDYFLPANHSYFNSSEYETDEGFLRKGLYQYGTGKDYDYSANVTVSYLKTFKEKHQLYVGVDWSVEEAKGRSYFFEMEGFTSDDISSLITARQYVEDASPSGSVTKTRLFGLVGNINYIYDNKYYVDGSFRVDGSSTFGSDKKYAPFWSVGIGWNLHNEKWLQKSIFNVLRLKASYGQTGTQQGSNTGSKTTYSYVSDNYYMNWTGSTLNGWGNPKLTWQTTDELNVGVEFALWKGRLKGSFEFYDKTTDNLLSYLDTPYSTGFSSYLANVGQVKNRGWEASLSGYIIRDPHKEFNWMAGVQLVYNKNWISELSEAIKAQTEARLSEGDDVDNLLYEGKPQNAIYAVRSYGIDPSTGNEVYLDKDGNITDTWSASDKVYLGSSDQKYRGTANSMVMWKGFTLNVSFGFYWGGKVYNQTLIDRVEVTTNTLMTSNVDSRVYNDRWMTAGDVTFFKGFSNEETKATSRFVMDDRVLELQSVSLQYRWDNDWIKKFAHVSSITFGVNMSDIYQWSSVKMERGTSYPYSRNIQGSIKFLF